MRILVATDFSSSAETAGRTAALLARRLAARVVIARAIEPPAVLYPEMAGADVGEMESALEREIGTQVEQTAIALRNGERADDQKIEVTPVILFGFPEQVIPAYARTESIDLVVMGAHGRSGVSRLLLGSVCERIIMDSPCAVLIVRSGETPFTAWADGRQNLRVVIGVDTNASSDGAIAWLRAFRQRTDCDVVLVHHYWPPSEYARRGLQGPRDLFNIDPQVAALAEQDIRQRVGDLPGTGSVEVHIRAGWGKAGEALADEARDDRADLLILGTHQPHGWDRITHGSAAITALRSTQLPLLCVPAPPRPNDAIAPSPHESHS